MRRRTNTFKLKPTKEQGRRLFKLADNCLDYGMRFIISGGSRSSVEKQNRLEYR
ncbi:MAG: hypothetical protein OD815_000781 [Candidatus Alkanophagales archaeon MCA70_species_2]|nr:hypothetical protein [Candidatus Alkanophaga liquidiphilum]